MRVVFEPIVKLESRQLLGYEALVRGTPGSEFANPAQLFAAAAECDALFELDCLCRRTALRAAGRLPQGAKLFLNCLPSAIHDPALQDSALRDQLARHGLRPSDVVFEISERESIDNFAVFREVCDHYSALGFQIALDDVGVGYSSLEAVTELAPDFLKVDMSFVRGIDEDPARQEILKALTSIAWRIDARIIAEGIETDGELRTLRELAISYGQGYRIGRANELQKEGGDAALARLPFARHGEPPVPAAGHRARALLHGLDPRGRGGRPDPRRAPRRHRGGARVRPRGRRRWPLPLLRGARAASRVGWGRRRARTCACTSTSRRGAC